MYIEVKQRPLYLIDELHPARDSAPAPENSPNAAIDVRHRAPSAVD
jgi:hypothetical protein